MQQGIDRKAFSAEIKALGRDDRRRVMREFGEWMRAASRAAGWTSYLGLGIACLGFLSAILAIEIRSLDRQLVLVALVIMAAGSALNMWSAGRARRWRREHPFEQWRTSR